MNSSKYEIRLMEIDGWADWSSTTITMIERLHRSSYKGWRSLWKVWASKMEEGSYIQTTVDGTLRQIRLIDRGLFEKKEGAVSRG